MKFEVTYEGVATIQAKDVNEARKRMKEKYPEAKPDFFFNPETEEDHEVVGICEYTGLAIFEEDDYSHDTEGIMWLNNPE